MLHVFACIIYILDHSKFNPVVDFVEKFISFYDNYWGNSSSLMCCFSELVLLIYYYNILANILLNY